MLKKILISSIVLVAVCFYFYQENQPKPTDITWQTLGEVKFKPIWYAPYKTNVSVPLFPDTLKKLDKQLVEITGFYIPMGMNSDSCAVSKNPNSSCFFCGGGTIETIVMVSFASKMRDFDDDEVITIKGMLELDTAFNAFIYNLKDARYVRSGKK